VAKAMVLASIEGVSGPLENPDSIQNTSFMSVVLHTVYLAAVRGPWCCGGADLLLAAILSLAHQLIVVGGAKHQHWKNRAVMAAAYFGGCFDNQTRCQ